MIKAEVDPKELTQFAYSLKHFNQQLQQGIIRLNGQFVQLGSGWQDQEYQKFAQVYQQLIKIIDRFTQATEQHIPFLLRKAEYAQAYIDLFQKKVEDYLINFDPQVKSKKENNQALALLHLTRIIEKIRVGMKEGKKYSFQMMQGKAGEMVTLIDNDNLLLDDIKLSGKGGKFVVYDLFGMDDTVGSVKVRGIKYLISKRASPNYIYAYKKDFLLAIGYTNDARESNKFVKAASLLLEAKEKRLISITDEIKKVITILQMQTYLYEHGALFVPDDHILELRKFLKKEITKNPESFKKFGLKDSTETQIDEFLKKRVRPIGIATELIKTMLFGEIPNFDNLIKEFTKLQTT